MDGRQSLKKPYAPGQCASTHRRLHRQILQGMVLPGHRFLSSICCVRSPIGCVPSSSSLFPISLHSTTSFSLVEKSKYPPSAQQKGRTRMSGFESQSAQWSSERYPLPPQPSHATGAVEEGSSPFFFPPGFESRRSRPRAPAGFRPRGRRRSQRHYPIGRTMVWPVLPLFAARQSCWPPFR